MESDSMRKIDKEEYRKKLDKFKENPILQKSINEDINDNIFYKLKEEETTILNNYFKEKQKDFINGLNKKNKINFNKFFYESIILSIIKFEELDKIYEKKIMKKLKEVENNKSDFKIDYISVMLIGKSGVGKSTLINEILKLDGNQRSEEGTGPIITTETKPYKSKKVPYLRLIDTRGFEHDKNYGPTEIANEARNYIQSQLEANPTNTNDFIQCIWYCTKGDRFEGIEEKVLLELSRVYAENDIPIIITYTQADDKDSFEKMKNYIYEQIKQLKIDILPILIKEIQSYGKIIKPFGKDKLIKQTLKKCKSSIRGSNFNVMTKNIRDHIIKEMENKNRDILDSIFLKTTDKYIKEYTNVKSDEEFKKYIAELLCFSILLFMEPEKQDIKSETQKIILTSDLFQTFVTQYIKTYKDLTYTIINKDIEQKAIDFLDLQAEYEIREKKNIKKKNKRSFEGFKKSINDFLQNNFYYQSQIFLINIIIEKFLVKFSNSLYEGFNNICRNLITNNNIQEAINNIYSKKFDEFQNNIVNNNEPEI